VWSDEEAYYENPKHRWVYDKLYVAKTYSGLRVWDLDCDFPTVFPVIMRPRYNLLGMGHKTFTAKDKYDVRRSRGYFAQEIAKGEHTTTDFIVVGGRIVDSFTFTATKDEKGSFTLFSSTNQHNPVAHEFADSIGLIVGVINVECIGLHVIECHLRPSLQFHDIDGGLVRQLPQLVKHGKWNKISFEKTYSAVLRVERDGVPHCDPLGPLEPGVRSVALTWEPSYPLSLSANDEHSYRTAWVNGDDLSSINLYKDRLKQSIKLNVIPLQE